MSGGALADFFAIGGGGGSSSSSSSSSSAGSVRGTGGAGGAGSGVAALSPAMRRLDAAATMGEQALKALPAEELQRVAALHRDGLEAAQSALTAKLLAEKRALEEKSVCIVCADRQIDCTLLPCGHRVMCVQCANRVDLCPIDREVITRKVKTFGW
jgi:prolyl-tRNA editing enzyme YbaK/EbsC (Cys-tRNA(Pro) deacylase)